MKAVIYEISELISFVRTHSTFYRNLYKRLPEKCALEDLPLLDQELFWKANGIRDNQVLSGVQPDGIVFKSGGTSGEPKFSFFSQQEWESFTIIFGESMAKAGLIKGSRVANLFYAGELYASFLFIMKSLENSGVPVVHFPLAGTTPFESLEKLIEEFEIDTLAGVPTTFVNFAEHLQSASKNLPAVKRILFGGESMYADQRARVQLSFPEAKIQSIGYASVDAGLLGYALPSSAPDVHHSFSNSTHMEIINEDDDSVIEECGQPGRLFVTNLTRKLMPILRYPAGDMAEWVDPPGTPDRSFRILGRSAEGARVGPATLYFEDLRSALLALKIDPQISNFQMLVTHFDTKDLLTLRLACNDPSIASQASEYVLEKVLNERPMLRELIGSNLIHKPRIEWVHARDLEFNKRSGKLKHVIDLRKQNTNRAPNT